MILKDEICNFICTNFIQPARNEGKTTLTIISGNVHNKMNLKQKIPAVCNALRSDTIEEMCNIRFIEEIRKPNVKKDSSTNEFRFNINTDINKFSRPIEINNSLSNIISPKEFEKLCLNPLEKHYNTKFNERIISDVPKRFDFVSVDERIIGDAKYYTQVRGERIPPAKFSVIAEHVWLLEKTSADKKFLIFGNDRKVPEMWLDKYGFLVFGVEFYFYEPRTGIFERLN